MPDAGPFVRDLLFCALCIIIVKLVPVWFPGAYFQRLAERGYKLSQEMKFRPYRDMKEKVVSSYLSVRS